MAGSGTEHVGQRFRELDRWTTGDVLEALWAGQSRAVAAGLAALPAIGKAPLAAALREVPEPLQRGTGEDHGRRKDNGAIAVSALRLEAARIGFQVARDGVFADDVEVDLVFAEEALGGNKLRVGGFIAEPHGARRQQEGDGGIGASHGHEITHAANIRGKIGKAGLAHV